MATRASGYRWAYVHDPEVAVERLAGQQRGGRRGQMTMAEIARFLEGTDLKSLEGRQLFRDRLLRLYLAGRIGSVKHRDLLATADSAAKDTERTPKPAPRSVVVEIQKFGEAAGNGAGSEGRES